MTHHMGDNHAIAVRFAEEWNKGNLNGLMELIGENVVDHNPAPGQPPGKAGVKQALGGMFAAFPDLKLTNDFVIVEGDRVVDHGTARGTHKGNLSGIPPSGKHVEFTYSDIYRVADGKIAEIWHVEDIAAVMQQIGAMPAPGGH